MGTLLFIVLHFIALLFFMPALFLTIPLHLIYAATRKKPEPRRPVMMADETKCPSCQEIVKKGAIKCKHCGSEIAQPDTDPKWLRSTER